MTRGIWLAIAVFAPALVLAGVRYEVVGPDGGPIPAKLTFLDAARKAPAGLKIETRLPGWAARANVVYTLPSTEAIAVPAGRYIVIASHGFEWTISEATIDVPAQGEAKFSARLERVLDTRGLLSADLHLHTLTFSGHGDSNVEERIITLCAENVEWAVATDHNHVTNYADYLAKLGAAGWIGTVPGNEVTTTWIGHFNAFPMDPAKPTSEWKTTDPRELFRALRADGAQVIQVNHPRWVGARGAYFRELSISPFTGDSPLPEAALGFDAFEVVNGNDLAGWVLQPEFGTGETPQCDRSVRDDWYNFLNLGLSLTAVGNSDSHHVDAVIAGCPRNFLRSSTDDPAKADPGELAASIRAGAVSVSSGILVEASCGKAAPGSLLRPSIATDGTSRVELSIKVQAAPWIRADRLIIVANGEEAQVIKLDPAEPRPVVRYSGTFTDRPARDSWYVVIAIGDEAPVPVQHASTFPLGFTNAFRFDVDGDGRFTPLREHARRLVEPALRTGLLPSGLAAESPSFRRQVVGALGQLAAGGADGEQVCRLLTALGADRDQRVRHGAIELLSRRKERGALLGLLGLRAAAEDAAERARLDFELARAGHLPALRDLKPYYDRVRGLERQAVRRDLLELVRSAPLPRWEVAGPYPSSTWREGLYADWPPESTGKADSRVRWRELGVDKRVYLNLREGLDPRVFAVGYARRRFRSETSFSSALLVESENGIRIFLGGQEVYRQDPRKSSTSGLEIVPVTFPAGEVDLLLKCSVETGAWGAFVQVVDPGRLLVELPPTAESSGR